MSDQTPEPRYALDRDGDLWQSLGHDWWRCLTTESTWREVSNAAGSVPVASSEPTSCERCGHPVHAVGCLARPLVHGGTYTCGCGGTDDVRTVATPPSEPADDEDETPTSKITRSEAEALRTKAAPIDLLASLRLQPKEGK